MTTPMTYARYLALEELLAAQHPLSDAHDELLFIVIHQASELWLKLCIHELAAARALIQQDSLRPAFKMLSRVARTQSQLIQSWDVLATMTPSDYSAIRPHLGPSSGFQSHQYRMVEFMMGARDAKLAAMHETKVRQELEAEARAPSLYDSAVALLSARGFSVQPRADVSAPYVVDPALEAAWTAIYRDPETYWDLYELAEKLVDLEYHFQRWRFGHLKTVERIIGHKRGTGGTAGVPYLEGVLKQVFFPELLSVRTSL